MIHLTFSQRIKTFPLWTFVFLSHHHPEKEQHIRTLLQAWVRYLTFVDKRSNDYLVFEIHCRQISKSRWPEVHRIWKGMDPLRIWKGIDLHDDIKLCKELRPQVEAFAGNLRITMLNSHGELIATTGGLNRIDFGDYFLEIKLNPMELKNEQSGSGGTINVSIIIDCSGLVQIRCTQK